MIKITNRTRNIRQEVRLSESEWEIVKKKMGLLHTTNFSVYARKMLIDGLAIHKDFSDLKDLTRELAAIGNNINQIAKKVNGTGSFARDDLNIMNHNYKNLMREINVNLLKRVYEDRRDYRNGSRKDTPD